MFWGFLMGGLVFHPFLPCSSFAQDQDIPDFELLDERQQSFHLYEKLSRSPDQKLLLAFFPAAFTEAAAGVGQASSATGRGQSESLLSTLMENLGAIK